METDSQPELISSIQRKREKESLITIKLIGYHYPVTYCIQSHKKEKKKF